MTGNLLGFMSLGLSDICTLFRLRLRSALSLTCDQGSPELGALEDLPEAPSSSVVSQEAQIPGQAEGPSPLQAS